ncbi:MAG: sulfite exporter TauE/SafE family protein [Bacteroidetes bacterium]|nr:sulfite exporter TauE/SafE family protein [Bacteroidota bacterium]MBS1650259.1 sulfite exporter TauE/SafE family protein [Bacteroidota bacterium]
MFAIVLAGLAIGFIGSFHCIGMCGPIALSLPVNTQQSANKIVVIVLYNIGRAFTYALLGVLFGLIGNQFVLIGYQQILSVVLGCFILLVVLLNKTLNIERVFFKNLHIKVQNQLAYYLVRKNNAFNFFTIGLLNGLLPCGLVYLAITSAMATGSIINGALLMFAFGLGTSPLMFSIMVLHKAIGFNARRNVKKIMPLFIVLTACMLILRGMNLGIPFISPAFSQQNKTATLDCH